MFYFAYGSNMDLKRIEDLGLRLHSINFGHLPGWKLIFNVIDDPQDKSSYANIVPHPGSKVEGLIIETNGDGIKKLDWNESIPNFYRRKKVTVIGPKKRELECITYVGNPKRLARGLKPRRAYMNHLLNGKLFLHPKYLKKLEAIETLD